MPQYLQNAPVRRLTYGNSAVFKLWLAALAVIGMMAFTQAAYAAFTLKFDQSAYQGRIWIQVQKDTSVTFTATYASGTKSIDFTMGDPPATVTMSKPVLLSDIGAAGLNITYADTSKIYVFYDDPSGNDRTVAPDHMSPNFPQRFQDVEFILTGKAADYGDLTYINWYSAPLSVKTYDASQNLLQQSGFNTDGTQIAKQLAAASGGKADAVMKDAAGNLLRYLGPSNDFSSRKDGNPWPSFIPYTQAVNLAGQSTHLLRATNYNLPDGNPVYRFGIDMTATAGPDGSLSLTGKITASLASGSIKDGNPAIPAAGGWTGASCSFSAADAKFNQAIYGQVWDGISAVSFSTAGWSDFYTFCQNTLQDPTKAHDPDTNPNLLDPKGMLAFSKTKSVCVGEITSGLICGYVNSNYPVGSPPVAIKNMVSDQWWSLSPVVAFATVQPAHAYYNTYARVIFDNSGNTLYSFPYGDRITNGANNPALYSVSYNGTPVASWVVGIGAPLPKKAPTAMLELLLLE